MMDNEWMFKMSVLTHDSLCQKYFIISCAPKPKIYIERIYSDSYGCYFAL